MVPYNCAAQLGFYLKNCEVFQSVLKVFSGANAHSVIALITIHGKE